MKKLRNLFFAILLVSCSGGDSNNDVPKEPVCTNDAVFSVIQSNDRLVFDIKNTNYSDYEIAYSYYTQSADSGVYIEVTNNTFQKFVDDLKITSGKYNFYIRKKCTSGYSDWSKPLTIEILPYQCSSPSNFSYRVDSKSGFFYTATIVWDIDSSYNYEYAIFKEGYDHTPTSAELSTMTNGAGVTVPNLITSTKYYFYVRKVCKNNSRSNMIKYTFSY